jgi:hypothetical protein
MGNDRTLRRERRCKQSRRCSEAKLREIRSNVEVFGAAAGRFSAFRHGVPVAAVEGDLLRTFGQLEPGLAADAAAAAAGRRVPVISGFVGRLSAVASLVSLEVLHGSFVLLCGGTAAERAEIAATPGLRILLARVEPVFS